VKEVPWVACANYEVTPSKEDPIVTKVEIFLRCTGLPSDEMNRSSSSMSSSSASPDDTTMDTSNSLVPG
jgi:hypothetical protein